MDKRFYPGSLWYLYEYSNSEALKQEAHERTMNVEPIKHVTDNHDLVNFILNHRNLPNDMVTNWDFNAPDIPDARRDASAAAIMASALLELSTFVKDEFRVTYFNAAEHMLGSSSSSKYLAEEGENGNFILKHSVGLLPGNNEFDVPLTYADYYFIEALMKYFLRLKIHELKRITQSIFNEVFARFEYLYTFFSRRIVLYLRLH